MELVRRNFSFRYGKPFIPKSAIAPLSLQFSVTVQALLNSNCSICHVSIKSDRCRSSFWLVYMVLVNDISLKISYNLLILFLSLFLGRRLTSNTKNRMPKQLELGISMSSYHKQPEVLRKAINLIIMNYFNKHQLNTCNTMGNVIGTILLTLTIPHSLFLRTVSVKGWGWILCLPDSQLAHLHKLTHMIDTLPFWPLTAKFNNDNKF